MQSQNFKPRDPKTPLDIDIDNIAYNETYDEDLEYYGLEEDDARKLLEIAKKSHEQRVEYSKFLEEEIE